MPKAVVVIESDADEAETTRVFRPAKPLARRMEQQVLIQQGRSSVTVTAPKILRQAIG